MDPRDTGILMKQELGIEVNFPLDIAGKTHKVWRLKQMKVDQIEFKKPERKKSNY